MKIEGIENVNRVAIKKAIIQFICDNIDNDDIIIEVIDEYDYLYSINGTEYVIIPDYEENSIITSYNNDLFDDSVTEVRPVNWIDYINRESWIDDNGVHGFEDYYEYVYDKSIKYEYCTNDIDFYRVL